MPRVKQARPRRLRKTTRPARLVMGRRVGAFGRYKPRKPASVEYASCKCSLETQVQAGIMNYFWDFQLSDLALVRAQQIAKNYQFYKITKIELVVQSQYDSYIPANPQTMPQIFWMIDKGRNMPLGLSFQDIQELGGCPTRS